MTMPDPTDARVTRALDALREIPAVPPETAARVAARAVLGARRHSRMERWGRPLLAAAVVALVFGTSLVLRDRTAARERTPIAVSDEAMDNALLPVTAPATTTLADTPRPIVFAVHAPRARVVRVVGDFNQWSRGAHTMHQDADGTWRLTALVPPGRYVFAYLVDDQRWVRDSTRAPVDDPDFGIAGSELIVGTAP